MQPLLQDPFVGSGGPWGTEQRTPGIVANNILYIYRKTHPVRGSSHWWFTHPPVNLPELTSHWPDVLFGARHGLLTDGPPLLPNRSTVLDGFSAAYVLTLVSFCMHVAYQAMCNWQDSTKPSSFQVSSFHFLMKGFSYKRYFCLLRRALAVQRHFWLCL